jgi:RNA polymerase sigma-70 factor (ECF subfamily)
VVDSNAARRLADRVRGLLTVCDPVRESDGEVLGRFVAPAAFGCTRSREAEDAFAELVHRLGPMVLRTCQRVLGCGPDAEDAFQVTFLVLARKARSVDPPGRVAAWVYGVARLAAQKARAARSRRRLMEVAMPALVDVSAPGPTTEVDTGAILDEELNRLPEKYRLPVVLCELRGQTIEQVARELDWPKGTVASRLARGRALLASRLVRRGVACVLALGAAAGTARARSVTLMAHTVQAALGVGPVADSVVSLTTEVLRSMASSKFRLVTAGLLVLLLGAAVTVPFDPVVPRTEAAPVPGRPQQADPLDRMKPDGLFGMLAQESVLKDLQVDEGQKKLLAAARKEGETAVTLHLRALANNAGPKLPPGAPPGVMPADLVETVTALIVESQKAGHKAYDKSALAVLRPAQVRRLKQLALQAKGPAALLDRRVIRALDLTAEQEDIIEELLPTIGFTGEPTTASDEQKKADAALRKVLSPEQLGRWGKLTGTPHPAKALATAGRENKKVFAPAPMIPPDPCAPPTDQ